MAAEVNLERGEIFRCGEREHECVVFLSTSWWTAASRGAVEGAAASWRGGSSSARAVATEDDEHFPENPLEDFSLSQLGPFLFPF